MKHIECKTPYGRVAEVDYFRKNKKDWIRVKFFGYHISYEFCLEKTSLEDALRTLDDNYKSIELAESEYLEEWEKCND